jgi:flagellin-specific chaperone FliS
MRARRGRFNPCGKTGAEWINRLFICAPFSFWHTGSWSGSRRPEDLPVDSRKKTKPESGPRRATSGATPHQLVGMAYELAIRACQRRETARSERAVQLLQGVMRFAGPEDSSDLMSCYDWCVDRIRSGEFAQAAQTLSDLRRAWEETERRFPG